MSFLFYILRPTLTLYYKTVMMAWRPDGLDNIPKKGAILAANHTSSADGVLMNSYLWKPVRFLAKEELFSNPIKNFVMKGVGQIPIKRGGSDREAFQEAIHFLNRGSYIGIFPEGTRGDGKKFRDPHTGAIRLALISGAPIVPVGISGGLKAWPKGSFHPRFFKKVRVRFGKPWKVKEKEDGTDYSYEELKELSRSLLFDRIRPLLDDEVKRPF